MKTVDYEFKRGDTFQFKKFKIISQNGDFIKLSDKDKIYLTIKKTENGIALIKKNTDKGIVLGDDGYYHITLESEDTKKLKAGTYVYDLELTLKTIERTIVKTIIEGTIELLQDVTNNEEDY